MRQKGLYETVITGLAEEKGDFWHSTCIRSKMKSSNYFATYMVRGDFFFKFMLLIMYSRTSMQPGIALCVLLVLD